MKDEGTSLSIKVKDEFSFENGWGDGRPWLSNMYR